MDTSNLLTSLKRNLPLLFLFISIPVVLCNIFMVAPFQGADERNHFFRALQISRGELIGQFIYSNGAMRPGGMVDSNAIEISAAFDHIKFHKEVKVDPYLVEKYRPTNWNWPEKTGIDFANTVIYSPIFYFPSAIGLKVSQLLNTSILNGLLLGRLANAIFCLFICYLALKKATYGRTTLFTICCLPMSLSLFGLISQDGLIISCTALLFALLTNLEQSNQYKLIIAIIIALLIIAKITYFPFLLLMFLTPIFQKNSKYFYASMIIIFVSIVVYYTSCYGPLKVPFRVEDGVDAKEQLKFLFSNINLIPDIIFNTIHNRIDFYYVSFIGNLGWLDVNLQPNEYAFYAILIALAIFIDIIIGKEHYEKRNAYVAMCVVLLCVVSVFLSLYLGWTIVGTLEVDGVQGRYFIPLVILLPLCFNVRIRGCVAKEILLTGSLLICLLNTYSWLAVPHALMTRYWG